MERSRSPVVMSVRAPRQIRAPWRPEVRTPVRAEWLSCDPPCPVGTQNAPRDPRFRCCARSADEDKTEKRSYVLAPRTVLTIVRAHAGSVFQDPRATRRGGRVAEGARLESVYAGNRIAGSNPASSAKPTFPTVR